MFDRLPETAQDVARILDAKYDASIASGQFSVFLYPWGTVGAAAIILYLLVDHRSSPFLKSLRWPVWFFNAVFSIHCILFTRARNPAAAFGVGLISAWSLLWTATIVIVNDCQTDFRRIERRERVLDQSSARLEDSAVTSSLDAAPGSSGRQDQSGLSQRGKTAANGASAGEHQSPAQRQGTFTWQSYPTKPFVERLDWVADIFSNFRGMGWNWRIAGLSPPPRSVQEDLAHNDGESISKEDTHVGRIGNRRYHTKDDLLRRNIFIFVRNYLILDLMKTLLAHDPYMWGVVGIYDEPAPGYLPASIGIYPVARKSARLLVSLASISYALEFIFSLGPLFFVGLVGPHYLGARGEPWMYPDHFGSFDNVLDKGLAGWWGGWWHQSFRFSFQEPARKLVEVVGLDPKGQIAKFLQLLIAFTLSGMLHVCGSYTQVGDTRPLSGPLFFFVSQAVGIALQMVTRGWLKKSGVSQHCPRWLVRTVNFIYAHVWLYFTAPFLVDDFARGGVWLFEPVPISIFRGLGFGSKHDGVWQWYGQIAVWHRGKHWWDTGIAL